MLAIRTRLRTVHWYRGRMTDRVDSLNDSRTQQEL